MSATTIAEWIFAIGLVVAIGVVWARSVVSAGRRGRLHLMAWRRAPRARRVAEAAALDDPVFAPAGDDRHARRLDLVWELALDEATHEHPRWRLVKSSPLS